jgi:nucleoside-triphosphatase
MMTVLAVFGQDMRIGTLSATTRDANFGQPVRSMLLITGRPGSGKTTALRRAAERLRGWRLGGFLTEEIRERGERRGFRALTFDGRARDLARADWRLPARVGRYGVDVAVMDALADELDSRRAVDAWLVDEIGKMECLSRRFVSALRALLDGPTPIVATIALRGSGFIAEVKRHPRAEVWTVSSATRDTLPGAIVEWLSSARRGATSHDEGATTRAAAVSGRRRRRPAARDE